MSILNVDKIQPIGGGSTITVDATDIQALTSTITASKFVGSVSVTGISTFNDDSTFYGATSGRDIVWDKSNDYLMVKDNARIVFGNSGDLSIRHLSSNNTSYVSSTTNNVIHEFNKTKTWTLTTTSAEKRIHCPADSTSTAVELYHNGSKKFETTSSGVDITGAATFSGNITANGNIVGDNSTNISGINDVIATSLYTSDSIIHRGETADNTKIRFPADDTVTVETDGSERLRIDDNGRVIIGDSSSASPSGILHLYQASNDPYIYIQRGSGDAANAIGGIIWKNNTNNLGQIVVNSADINDSNMAFKTMYSGTLTEAFRIDNNGTVLVGHTASEGMFYTGRIQVQGTNSTTSAITVKSNQNDSGGPAIVLGKSRSGSVGGNAVVQSGDELGCIYFNGADGTDTVSQGAYIRGSCDGTPGSNDMPGRLVFGTTADGAATATERLRIDSAGAVILSATFNSNTDISPALVIGSSSFSRPGIVIRGNSTNKGDISFCDNSGSDSSDGVSEGLIRYDHDGDYMCFHTADAETVRITSAGQVAIANAGNSGASAKLLVYGGADNSDVAIFSGGDYTRGLKISTAASTNNDALVIFDAQNADNGCFSFKTHADERMTIGATGIVNIPAVTNSSSLSMNPGGNAGSLVFDRNGHITSMIRASDGGSNVAGNSGGGSRMHLNKEYIQFFTFPYTTNQGDAPTYSTRFQVDTQGVSNYGSGNGNGRYHFSNSTANVNRHAEHSFGRTGGSNRGTTACIYVGEDGSAQGEVIVVTSASNGSLSQGVSIANNAQSWSAYSDTRLKNKISDITNALSGISQIDTWKYSMKSDATNEPKLGVTAQSIESVYPEVISKRTKITDPNDDTEYMQVAYTELIPVCIAAIKELKTKVETLETEVAALKSS